MAPPSSSGRAQGVAGISNLHDSSGVSQLEKEFKTLKASSRTSFFALGPTITVPTNECEMAGRRVGMKFAVRL